MCRQSEANPGHLLCADSQGLIQDTCRVHAASYRLVRTLVVVCSQSHASQDTCCVHAASYRLVRTLIVCSQELARTFVVCSQELARTFVVCM